MDKPIILASRSPRRKELLPRIGLHNFLVEEADIDEAAIMAPLCSCEEAVRVLALEKARIVASRHPDALVIGSDTAVTINGRILGKPADIGEAFDMLRMLSGREHEVMSGIAVITDDREFLECEISLVKFRELTDCEILRYIDLEKPFDKAGAYGIQGMASLFIERINGDYYNVMGLPLFRLGKMLTSLGINLL